MLGGYNMNIRCNLKFMFCKDRGIVFRVVQGIRVIYEPSNLGISTLLPAGQKKVAFQRINRHRKLNFRRRRDKIVYCVGKLGSELFQSRAAYRSRLKLPSRTSQTYYFLSFFVCINRSRQSLCRDPCNN